MKNEAAEPRVCPKCHAVYTAHPALSRDDSETLICPDCGTREALAAMGIDKGEIEKIIAIIRSHIQP